MPDLPQRLDEGHGIRNSFSRASCIRMLDKIDGLCADPSAEAELSRLRQALEVLSKGGLVNTSATIPTAPFIKALAEVRHLSATEGWCYHTSRRLAWRSTNTRKGHRHG